MKTTNHPDNNPVKEPVKGKNGGVRKGAGRPKGSKNIQSQDSVARLEELRFDPITEMVRMVEQIDRDMVATITYKDGSEGPAVKTGSVAHAQLTATRATMINNLMRYGYRPVVEKTEVDTKTGAGMMNINFDMTGVTV